MKSVLKLVALAICLLASGACDRADDGTGLSQSRVVDVIVELRRASVSAPDPAAFAVRKEQILRDAGVTEDQLRAYITAHQRDLRHMAAVWESINVRLADPETM